MTKWDARLRGHDDRNMAVLAKICGIQDQAALDAACNAGASFVGFVFFEKSGNYISPQRAAPLAERAAEHIPRVGLFVDAADDEIRAVLSEVPLDLLQLHGHESPNRVAAVRAMTGLPVMKALRLKDAEQAMAIPAYDAVADRLLFDSRIGNEPSGGAWAWGQLRGLRLTKPWMLAGGLTALNVREAVRKSGAAAVDVSSGVEDAPHHKDPEKIREFLAAVAGI